MNREELFDKFLQRSLSGAEARELKRLLQEDPRAGQELVEHVTEASMVIRVGSQVLQSQLAPSQLVPPELTPAAAVNPSPAIVTLPAEADSKKRDRGRFAWRMVAGIAAAVLGLAALSCVLWLQPPPLHAILSNTSGEVAVARAGKSIVVEPGLPLQQGDILQTAPQARAAVVFEGEATRLDLSGDSRILLSATRHGKRVQLLRGTVEGSVAPQLGGQALTCATLHGEVRSRNARFLLAAEVSSTRLEVTKGTVEFVRHTDGQSLTVKQGCSAVSSPSVEFSVRPFLPEPWQSQDIGAVGLHGQGRFDGRNFRLRGAGQDTCCTKDQLHFTHQELDGDGEIIACVRDIEFTDPEAKAMVMIRQTLKSASPQVSLGLTAAGGLEFEQRAGTESTIRRVGHAGTPRWLRLVRRGNVVEAFQSANGGDWIPAGSCPFAMPSRVHIGIGVTSYNHAALSTGLFDEVRVVKAAP